MITSEMLFEDSLKCRLEISYPKNKIMRDPKTVFSKPLSFAEINEGIKNPDNLISLYVSIVENNDCFFLTDDTSYGWKILKSYGFVSCSISIPCRVVARPCVPDGYIKTAQDLIAVFVDQQKPMISNEQKLLDYLNGRLIFGRT